MWFSNKQHNLLGIFLLSGAIVALLLAGTAQAQSIAVHLSDYAGNGYSGITAGTPDGIQLPDSSWNANWTNVSVNWFSGGASNLQDNTGTPTTAAVSVVANSCGTYWWVNGPSAGVDNLLEGPWGGVSGGAEAIPDVITGIPYANYEIIAYANPPYTGNHDIWLDSNPASSNAYNTPVAGSQYYFSQDSHAFDMMANNTDDTSFPAGNTVVWSGLSGSNQTLWVGGLGGATNEGITGFEIVNTPEIVPEPSTLALLGVAAIGLLAWRKRRAA